MMNRRVFLSKSAAGTVGLALRPARAGAHAQPSPNDTINVAIIGLRGQNTGHPNWTSRGRGLDHYEHLSRIRNVRITHVVDIDERHFGTSLSFAKEKWGGAPRTETDFRRVLDDRDVHAVTIAAPDHWHRHGAARPGHRRVQAGREASGGCSPGDRVGPWLPAEGVIELE